MGTTTWVGKVGLMSPSDYAYATEGGTNHNLNTCLSTHNAYPSSSSVQSWSNTYTDCKNNNWLLVKSGWQWTISPRSATTSSYNAYYANSVGYIYSNYDYNPGQVLPVVFLNTNVRFIGGTGTSTEPYILASA